MWKNFIEDSVSPQIIDWEVARKIGLVPTSSSASITLDEWFRTHSVTADADNADVTLTYCKSSSTLIYHTPITANRAVTLSTTGAASGATFRVVRDANCTGAFNVNVGTGPLKSLTAAGQWCDVSYNGTSWILTASGSL